MRKTLAKRILGAALTILFLAALAIVGRILFRYNLFVFERASREARREMPALEKYGVRLVKWFTFQREDALKEWEEKILKGRVVYTVERDSSGSFVHAKSDKTASALYYKITLDAKGKTPVVMWRWNVERFPAKKLPERLDTRNEDDFAARVYVIFPAKFFTNSKVIEYIWAEMLPVGQTGISPYSKNIRLMVLRSGAKRDGAWQLEERNIIEDYVTLFGEKPRLNVGAVAFMTDADTTETSADSLYTDIKLGYKEEPQTRKGG